MIFTRYLLIASLVASLFGCRDDTVDLSINGLNYTNRYVSDFSVNGYSGFDISRNGGGGSFVCCVSVPKRWREDLRVTVRWHDDDAAPEKFKEKVVAVPEYHDNDFGAFVVHFYPDDTVKVLVTSIFVGHANYPYPRPGKSQ